MSKFSNLDIIIKNIEDGKDKLVAEYKTKLNKLIDKEIEGLDELQQSALFDILINNLRNEKLQGKNNN